MKLWCWIPLVVAIVGFTEVASAAPQALRGKSVIISWTEARRERTETGQERSVNTPFKMTVYVSSQDKTFNRLSIGRGNSDQTSGTSDSSGFAARSVSFSGSQLSVTNSFHGGARQISATFSPGFSGCSGNVVIGRGSEGKPIRQKMMGGGIITLLSVAVGAVSCSISDGNALG